MGDAHAEHSRVGDVAAKPGLHESPCVKYYTQREPIESRLFHLREGLEPGEKYASVAADDAAAAAMKSLRGRRIALDHRLRSLTLRGLEELTYGAF